MSLDARIDEELATERRSRILGYDYYDTSRVADKSLYKEILSTGQIKSLRIVPLVADKYHILFGLTTTTPQQSLDYVKSNFSDQKVTFNLISDTGFKEYLEVYDPPPKVEYKDIDIAKAANKEQIFSISEVLEQVKADDMLAYLVQQAHKLNASDIHLESQDNGAQIRFRIDGVLHTIAKLTFDKYRMLISAIASAGNVSTASNDSQQGHIAQNVVMADGTKVAVNVRLETVQTIHSMDVVMRLFNMDESMFSLDKLGLSESEARVVNDIIAKPTGLVLIVGPTGSGKTTTLYSMLKSLANDTRKVITIEDPVEYQFKGITQIPANTFGGDGGSFAGKLRAVLRLDPDIVMVGEIRDTDTALTALQAALTGHLVMSTFHAADAASTLTRLADVIGYNPLFVSSIRLIMAQRLVRKLDNATKIPYEANDKQINLLKGLLSNLKDQSKIPDLNKLTLYKPGKSDANPFGYKGQIAVREQLLMSEPIINLLSDPRRLVTSDLIEALAITGGMKTMMQDAALKVIAGETTLDEMFRVL